ncbi:MAG: FKBP-type peptidyl-prolyl cis-trans isomerase [Actinomycetota bacterium]|nr:FKBP-type peptidyl-prolyl cis-trans isomerase [Actinomycetota bacterium]
MQVRDVTRPSAPVLDSIPVRGASPATGITVAASRVSKDSIPDLIVTGVRRGTDRILVHDGIVGRARNPVLTTFAPRETVVPGAPVGVAGIDTDADGRANVIRVASKGSMGPVLGIHRITHPSPGQVTVTGGVAAPGAAGGAMANAPVPATGIVTTQSGLQYRDLVVGTGAMPSGAGTTVRVAHEGWLLDGTRFDGPGYASISLGDAIAGWSEGLRSMRVGGRRQLIVPADLAYGAAGTASIPPNSTLVFDVQLLSTT